MASLPRVAKPKGKGTAAAAYYVLSVAIAMITYYYYTEKFPLKDFLPSRSMVQNLQHGGNASKAQGPTHVVNGSMSKIPPMASSGPRRPTHVVYDSMSKMPQMVSSGPRDVLPAIIGFYEFENVCLTRHKTESMLTGLIYFSPHDAAVVNNRKRCIPCSAPLNHEGGWEGTGRDEKEVGHKCGFVGVHAMFATSIEDWSNCSTQPEARRRARSWGQGYVPGSVVHQVHYYNEPMVHLSFRDNIGHDLFDHMLSILPYWHAFKSRGSYPFKAVTSLAHPGCMTDDERWYCKILRAINAFGDAVEEFPPGRDGSNDTTLYCYKNITLNRQSLQRSLRYHEQIPKAMFDEFRDILFEEFGLERERRFHVNRGNTTTSKKILLYAHEASGRRVWLGLKELIQKIRPRYEDVVFDEIDDFGAFTVRQQAHVFNRYDAHVMVHGAQMANSIFAVDRTLFVEVGCRIPEFIGNRKFMSLIDGVYKRVEKCRGSNHDANPCVRCVSSDLVYSNFTMTDLGFQNLVDEVLRMLEQFGSKVVTE